MDFVRYAEGSARLLNAELADPEALVALLVGRAWLHPQVTERDVTALRRFQRELRPVFEAADGGDVRATVDLLNEATSLIDPRAARHLERSLAAVLHGRTVIAIAHRLFSAHDADRVAVVEDGKISELGSHDELVAAGGSYAALWDSWNGTH